MKPTQEQLNDPDWWDKNAPEGAEAWVDDCFVKWDEGKEYIFTDSGWMTEALPWTMQQYKSDSGFCVAERPTKPEFVPEVGVECEGFTTDLVNNWKWKKVEPLKETSTGEFACLVDGRFLRFVDQFRPIKTERDLLIEIITAHGNLSDGVLADGILSAGFCLKEADK